MDNAEHDSGRAGGEPYARERQRDDAIDACNAALNGHNGEVRESEGQIAAAQPLQLPCLGAMFGANGGLPETGARMSAAQAPGVYENCAINIGMLLSSRKSVEFHLRNEGSPANHIAFTWKEGNSSAPWRRCRSNWRFPNTVWTLHAIPAQPGNRLPHRRRSGTVIASIGDPISLNDFPTVGQVFFGIQDASVASDRLRGGVVLFATGHQNLRKANLMRACQ